MPFFVGPALNIRLFNRLSLDTGLLYHRLGEREGTFAFQYPENAFTVGSARWRGRALEVPLLVRYGLLNSHSRWQPFLSAGAAVRRTSLDGNSIRAVFSGTPIVTPLSEPPTASHLVKWNVDPVVGAGVSVRAGRVRFEPQVRYSYWGAGSNSIVLKNQVQVLFGIRF